MPLHTPARPSAPICRISPPQAFFAQRHPGVCYLRAMRSSNRRALAIPGAHARHARYSPARISGRPAAVSISHRCRCYGCDLRTYLARLYCQALEGALLYRLRTMGQKRRMRPLLNCRKESKPSSMLAASACTLKELLEAIKCEALSGRAIAGCCVTRCSESPSAMWTHMCGVRLAYIRVLGMNSGADP